MAPSRGCRRRCVGRAHKCASLLAPSPPRDVTHGSTRGRVFAGTPWEERAKPCFMEAVPVGWTRERFWMSWPRNCRMGGVTRENQCRSWILGADECRVVRRAAGGRLHRHSAATPVCRAARCRRARQHAPTGDAGQGGQPGGPGDLPATEVHCRAGVRADQAGDGVQAVLDEGDGRSEGRVGPRLHLPQRPQALGRPASGAAGGNRPSPASAPNGHGQGHGHGQGRSAARYARRAPSAKRKRAARRRLFSYRIGRSQTPSSAERAGHPLASEGPTTVASSRTWRGSRAPI